MLSCCHLEILPDCVARRELSAVCRSLMVSRAVLLGINCIRSDSSLSASSTLTHWQALTHSLPAQPKDRPALYPCWEGPSGLQTHSSWDSGIPEEGLYYSVWQDFCINTVLYCLNVTICLLRQRAKWKCKQAGVAASHRLCSPASVKIHPAFTHWARIPKKQRCSRPLVQILLTTLLSK